jgi:hypothetical protein
MLLEGEANLVHRGFLQILPQILEAAAAGQLDWKRDRNNWFTGTWRGYEASFGANIFDISDRNRYPIDEYPEYLGTTLLVFFLDLGSVTTWVEPHTFGAALGRCFVTHSQYYPKSVYEQFRQLYKILSGDNRIRRIKKGEPAICVG